MRRILCSVALFAACTTAPTPTPAPAPATTAAAPEMHGLTVEEEARILELEDRRELDAATVDAWVAHPNALHRQRIALALGRIGRGVPSLIALAGDSDPLVRTHVALALGEIGDPAGIDTLFRLTDDPNATVGAEAAEALSKLARHVPVARYAALTRHATEGVRARAIRHLYRFNSDEASAIAAGLLEATSVPIRTEAVYALSRRAYAPARQQLELLLTDPNTMIRVYATAALGRILAPESARPLITALGDAHPWVRTNAIIALGRIAPKDKSILRIDDLPRLFAVLEDPDPGTRASAIEALGHYAAMNETARKRLYDLLSNGTRWERELAAGTVARHFGIDGIPQEPTPWMKVRILEATQTLPGGVSIRSVLARDPDPMVRANAIGNIPDERVNEELGLIRAALGDADVIVRTNGLDRYGKSNAEDKVAVFRAAEQRERATQMNDARLAAILTLAEIDFPEREELLRGLLEDNDPVVARNAAELIETKLGKPRPRFAVNVRPQNYAEIVRWSRQPHTATIRMTRGTIEVALLAADAPMTAWNFAQLAKAKYFDNTSFMRVVPNFVIQGGDPRNDMNGGPGYAIRDEINLQKYTRGAVGMALSGPDTGGSQFFITHSPQPHLDGGYTIFGRVYDGMNSVVDQVERGDRVETILVDARPPVGAAEISSVAPYPLPLEVGRFDAARLLQRVPDYVDRKSAYTPDITVLEMMKSYIRAGDRVEVFMGTWCPDSQREVPKFLRIADDLKSQFGVDLPATFFAVDRSKQKPAELIAGKQIEKISTFIYYRGDRELGRIVERPTSPLFEDDLLAIVAKE